MLEAMLKSVLKKKSHKIVQRGVPGAAGIMKNCPTHARRAWKKGCKTDDD